jgi:hypothetical protein
MHRCASSSHSELARTRRLANISAHEIALGDNCLRCNRNNSWLGYDTDDERQSLAIGDRLSRVRSRVRQDRLPPKEITLATLVASAPQVF